jgi:hypothetical protein
VTPTEILARWQARRTEWERLKVRVDGATLCNEVIADLEALVESEDGVLLSLTEAASYSGYSREHLGRLVSGGHIRNWGRPSAPRVRRGDLPIKAGHLPTGTVGAQVAASSKRRIVRSVAGRAGGPDAEKA